jgi:hypothetical protein
VIGLKVWGILILLTLLCLHLMVPTLELNI